MSSMELNGLDEILKKLEKKVGNIDPIKQEVTENAADTIKESVEQFARGVGDGTVHSKKYGRIADNITKTWDEGSGSWKVHTGKAYWAHFLEFGTVNMPAQPYFERGFRDAQKRANDDIVRELKRRFGL